MQTTEQKTVEPIHYAYHTCDYGRQFLRLSTYILADVDCKQCLANIERARQEAGPNGPH